MTTMKGTRTLAPGDWIDVDTVGATTPRRGQITEVLGTGEHVRYRVHWLDDVESIHYPCDGTHAVEPGSPRHRRVAAPVV